MAVEWQVALADYLIRAGTSGRKRSEIVAQFQNRANAATIENELEGWLRQDKVQKFKIPPAHGGGGRRIEVWRATTKMKEA